MRRSITARREWMAMARRKFRPGKRQPCEFCGMFRSISEAHHIEPLSNQFDRHGGECRPNQKYVWLCPNHHAVADALSGRAQKDEDRGKRAADALDDLTPRERDDFLRWFFERRDTHHGTISCANKRG